MKNNKLIITAASQSYGQSLLALLGSLNLNWPKHPQILVYDIGLDDDTLARLHENKIQVKKVPIFCDHWRKHFTWKIWCLNNAPAQDILWMDAGLVVLEPLDEIFDSLNYQGYFLVPNYHLLDWEASDAASRGCGVSAEFRNGKLTLAATMMGFKKTGKVLTVLEEALEVSLTEYHIAATETAHRHDQTLISLLMYKHFKRVVISDGIVYLGYLSPSQTPGQKVWAHRRYMLPGDMAFFASHITMSGPAYMPEEPAKIKPERKPLIFIVVYFVKRLLLQLFNKDKKQYVHVYDGVRD